MFENIYFSKKKKIFLFIENNFCLMINGIIILLILVLELL